MIVQIEIVTHPDRVGGRTVMKNERPKALLQAESKGIAL